MAEDLYPYSHRQDGAVSNLEHEQLWSTSADGILPGELVGAFSLSLRTGGGWVCNGGKMLIAGHVLNIDGLVNGDLAGGQAQTRIDVVCAYIDRSTVPWTYGLRTHPGSPGGGRPTIPQSPTGLYEVPIRAIQTATNGANTLLADERIRLTRDVGQQWQTANLTIPASLRPVANTGTPTISTVGLGGQKLISVQGTIERRDGANFTDSQFNSGIMAVAPTGFRSNARWSGQLSLTGPNTAGAIRLDMNMAGEIKAFSQEGGAAWVSLNGCFLM